jgi:hypothetical protein
MLGIRRALRLCRFADYGQCRTGPIAAGGAAANSGGRLIFRGLFSVRCVGFMTFGGAGSAYRQGTAREPDAERKQGSKEPVCENRFHWGQI